MAGVVRTMPSHSSRSAPRVVKAPRPPNAWIIYRSDKAHQLPPLEPGQPRRAQAEVSKMISNMWANEAEQTRQEYERRAEEAKAAHALKYPGYRFKPMKKEEKKAQREQEQNERLAKRREQRKTGSPDRLSLPPTPPPTASLPHYYASIHMPINLPQFAHTLPPLLPYPFMPYYASQTRFGPAGPTPPVSAAGSPSDPSPSPDTSNPADEPQNIDQGLTINDRSNGQASEVLGVPASKGSTTFDHTLFPSFNTSTFASGQEWPHAPANVGTLTPALTPSPLWPDADSNQPQETSASNHVVPAENVSFNFEPYQLSNLDNLLSGSTEDTLNAFIDATADPGVFRLTNLDSGQLLANPTGEIEVSLGEFPPLDLSLFPSELFNFHDPFATTLPDVGNTVAQELFMHPSQSATDGVPQTVSGSRGNNHDPSPLSNANYNPDDYLDFGPSSTLGEAADFQNTAPATTADVVASTGGYVPPTGATNSSLRRVGGTWNKPFLRAQTPSPPRITGVTQSQ